MTTEANGNGNTERPKAIVTKKFPVKVGNVTVSMGISPKTGTLCVYGWTDAAGYHSFGQFPAAKYASQWKAYAAVAPAVMGYIARDEQDTTTPRQNDKGEWTRLAYKEAKATITTGETIEIDATDSLVQMLVAQGMTREEAENLATSAA